MSFLCWLMIYRAAKISHYREFAISLAALKTNLYEQNE